MGVDSENIIERLSQLEMDVKQMNQLIDENLPIEDDEANPQDEEIEEEESSTDGENSESDDDTDNDDDDDDDEDDDEEEDGDESRDYHEVNENANTSYLQDEILEAIDNTQLSFIQNASNIHSSEDENVLKEGTPIPEQEAEENHNSEKGESNETSLEQSEEATKNISNETGLDESHETAEEETHGTAVEGNQKTAKEETYEAVEEDDSNCKEDELSQSADLEEPETYVNSTQETVPIENDIHNDKKQEENSPEELIPEKEDMIQENTIAPEETISENEHAILNEPTLPVENTPSEEAVVDAIEPQNTKEIASTKDDVQLEQPKLEEPSLQIPQSSTAENENENEDDWEEVSSEEDEGEEDIEEKVEEAKVEKINIINANTSQTPNEDRIILPKHNTTTLESSGQNNNIVSSTITVNSPVTASNITQGAATPVEARRRTTNPFRVISVSSPSSATSSRVSSQSSSGSTLSNNSSNPGNTTDNAKKLNDNIVNLQKQHDYLVEKCNKLEKEIRYLRQLDNQSTLSLDDRKKLQSGITKLQEYMDRKVKQRYEVGVLLSRQLRRQINRGENGEFWIGRK